MSNTNLTPTTSMRGFLARTSVSVVALTLICAAPASAQTSYSVSAIGAGGGAADSMVNSVGQAVGGVTSLIMGPGIWLVMAIGAMIALFGYAKSNKEALFTGIGLFILAAIILGIFSLIM